MTRRSTFAPLAVLSLLALATPAAGQLTVQEVYAKASSPGLFDMLGGAVAVSGDTLVVGARQEDSAATGVDGNATDDSLVNVGAAYVFRRTAGGWVQEAYLKPASGDGHDNFGHAVAIDGDTIAVGAPGEDGGAAGVPSDNSVSNAGAVYVFRRDGSTWSPEAYVKPTVTGAHDNFGFSVALSGETLAVGAYQEGGSSTGVGGDPLDEGALVSGAAYVFDRTGTTWTQGAYVKASNTGSGDHFGVAVALDGDVLAVGARYEDSGASGVGGDQADDGLSGAGAAYVFGRAGGTWVQEAYLKEATPTQNATFGAALTVSGTTVVVGAPVGGSGSQGEASVFVRSGGIWSHEAELVPTPSQSGILRFAASLSLDGHRLAVGAFNDKSGIPGVNGNPQDQSANGSGAVHLFERVGATWSKTTYVKASNPGSFDSFGVGCALDGDLLGVGADGEGSAAAGIDGDQVDDSLNHAGAVYAFDLGAACGTMRYGTYGQANHADLTSHGTPVPGSVLDLELSGFQGTGIGLVLVSLAPAQILDLGGLILVDPNLSLLGPGGMFPVAITAGEGTLSVPVPLGTAGLSAYAQGVLADASLPWGWAFTNGLEIVVCS